jgi:hypothetical protein
MVECLRVISSYYSRSAISVLGEHQRDLRSTKRTSVDLVSSIEVDISGVLAFSRDSNEGGVRHTSAAESSGFDSDRARESTRVRGGTLQRAPGLGIGVEVVLSQSSQLYRV